MISVDAVTDFVSILRQHFSTPKRTAAEEIEWVRSLARALRDYVPSELKRASEEIINTRTLRYFPLPKECLDACAHARRIIQMRAELEQYQAKHLAGVPIEEPGRERRYREDAAWRAKQHVKGITLRSDIDGRTDWWNWEPCSERTKQVLLEKNRGR